MLKSFTDHLGNEIQINFPPRRIVSLVPSQTELLFDLGLDEEIVGLTKFCIHPIEKFAAKQKVGGTKKLNVEVIAALKPDLIIGNKEENSKADIELLQQQFPVWMTDIYTLEDASRAITDIGSLVDRAPEANYLNHLITAGFRDLQTLALQKGINKTAAYIIWKEPYMLAGPQTFIHDVLTKIGLYNVVKENRYPAMALSDIAKLNPDFVFLSSEPYPFKQKHMDEVRQELPKAQVLLVDGEMFSWYGSRLVKAVQYFFEFQRQVV